MKMRIYVIDDEQMAIKYFEYLLKACGFPCELIGFETNSTRAVSEILHLKPDLVFADVSMPVMDGLELSRQVLSSISTKIILLTSYRDFDFVKQGIQLGVTDYLLKNELTEESLRQLLEKISIDILAEKKKQHMILEHNVRSFLNSSTEGVEDQIYKDRPLQRYGLIHVRPAWDFQLKYSQQEDNEKIDTFALQNLPYPDDITCEAFVKVEAKEYCGIYFIGAHAADGQGMLYQSAQQLIDKLQQNGISSSCVISDTCRHFFELQDVYRSLRVLGGYTYAYPNGAILKAGQLREQKRTPVSVDDCVSRVLAKLQEQAGDAALEAARDFFAQCRANIYIWDYVDNIRSIYRSLRNYVRRRSLSEKIMEIPEEYPSTEAAEERILHCISQIAKAEEHFGIGDYSVYVQQAIQFIRKNYSRDLSIPEIADAAGISEGHLRRLFKQELNTKVVDYLTEYRLNCAKLLLENMEGSAGDVWEKTGFASAQYFSYVFKKKEGVLPKDYRRQEPNE